MDCGGEAASYLHGLSDFLQCQASRQVIPHTEDSARVAHEAHAHIAMMMVKS